MIIIGFVQSVTTVFCVTIKESHKMPPKRILLSEWPLFVEKSFQQKNLRLIAVREQPKVSEKFQSEVHKYVLHLQNDRDIINLDEGLISLLNQLLNKVFQSVKNNYDEKTQKQIFGQINFTCQGMSNSFLSSSVLPSLRLSILPSIYCFGCIASTTHFQN